MTQQLHGLSSMATKALLASLSAALRDRFSMSVTFESAGGIEIVRDIRAGVDADLAVLGQSEMNSLDADGFLDNGTLTPLFCSDVVAAVRDGSAAVPLETEQDLRAALLSARRIAYSTGPSGRAIVELITRWGLVDTIGPKLLQALPGTAVGSLLAGGEADLGFQQRSEFTDLAGVRVLGPLPGTAAMRSTFSGAVLARSTCAEAARDVLRHLRSDDAEEHVKAAGMVFA